MASACRGEGGGGDGGGGDGGGGEGGGGEGGGGAGDGGAGGGGEGGGEGGRRGGEATCHSSISEQLCEPRSPSTSARPLPPSGTWLGLG